MNQRIKDLWVEDLLNPDYTPGKFKLRYRDSYCPLGRLCELHRREHPQNEWQSPVLGGGSGYTYLGHSLTLPLAVVQWAWLSKHVVPFHSFTMDSIGYDVSLGEGGEYRLTYLNDQAGCDGILLDKIVDLIKKYL